MQKFAIEKEKKKNRKCPVKEIKVSTGWCSKPENYIIKIKRNLDCRCDKGSYTKLNAEMKTALLKPSEDTDKLLTIRIFYFFIFQKLY